MADSMPGLDSDTSCRAVAVLSGAAASQHDQARHVQTHNCNQRICCQARSDRAAHTAVRTAPHQVLPVPPCWRLTSAVCGLLHSTSFSPVTSSGTTCLNCPFSSSVRSKGLSQSQHTCRVL